MEYKMVGLYKDKFSGLCSKFSTWSDFQGHEKIINWSSPTPSKLMLSFNMISSVFQANSFSISVEQAMKVEFPAKFCLKRII